MFFHVTNEIALPGSFRLLFLCSFATVVPGSRFGIGESTF